MYQKLYVVIYNKNNITICPIGLMTLSLVICFVRVAKDESHCILCNQPGDMQKQLFCTSCGQHYHSDCLEEEIECNTVVRAGWQCPDCKVCQGCRKPGDDNRMLVCDVCDKGYHTFCLNPSIKSIPPNGWRCSVCITLSVSGLLSCALPFIHRH